MKMEYDISLDGRDNMLVGREVSNNMLVVFEEDDEWYSLVYDDSWIAKAVRAHTNPRGQVWGDHVRDIMTITIKDLSEEELVAFEKIKAILKPLVKQVIER